MKKAMEKDERSRTLEEIQESWISGHLYYHQSLDPVVRGFVHPLVASLAKEGQINAFFFIRDGLGGPHIRLRLRVTPGARDSALAAMEQAARRFLDREPSTQPRDAEAIRQSNRHILAADPHEIDDSVYPDNSFQIIPFRPEIERYGGLSRFRSSLDFFTLSSVAAVELLAQLRGTPRSAQLVHAFSLLLEQALGFAADPIELADLLRYGVDSWGEALPKVIEKGDNVARSQMDLFLQLFEDSLAQARSLRTGGETPGEASDFLVAGASRLSAALGDADRRTRARVGGSQLHMTSSRLGLSNAEEVYLSRLLTVTLDEARARNAEDLSWIGENAVEGRAEDPGKALGALVAPALARLAEVPLDPGPAQARI